MYTSRRALLALLSAAPFLAPARAQAKAQAIRVGCQANGWPLKEGDFDQLLGVLKEMNTLGYTGFECNIRFVKAQFERAAEQRSRLESTGVQFIGRAYVAGAILDADFARRAAGVAALGGERIVLSARGLAPDGRYEERALNEKVAKLSSLAGICRQNGIRLAYHNHNPEFANHNAEIEALERSTEPGLVDFLVDAGHAYLGGGGSGRLCLAPRQTHLRLSFEDLSRAVRRPLKFHWARAISTSSNSQQRSTPQTGLAG